MSGTPDSDDSWAEFYREIGLEPERPVGPAVAEPAPIPEVEPLAETDADDEDDEDGPEEGVENEGPGGEEELNEDGTKKRRRRRRRRSKKKGVPGARDSAAEGEVESEVAEAPVAEVYEEDGGPSPEASRELIANWDVPSWSDIVASLQRPSGR